MCSRAARERGLALGTMWAELGSVGVGLIRSAQGQDGRRVEERVGQVESEIL